MSNTYFSKFDSPRSIESRPKYFLPSDVLLRICKQIENPLDIARFAQVSKLFKKVAYSNSLWKVRFLSRWKDPRFSGEVHPQFRLHPNDTLIGDLDWRKLYISYDQKVLRIIKLGLQQLGRVPPQWVIERRATQCHMCRTPFNFFTRKYSCRSCGNIFCSTCTSYTSVLPYLAPNCEPQRVCEDCHKNLALIECVKNDIFQIKVVSLGDNGIGKTAFLHMYVNKEFIDKSQPTMGVGIFTKQFFTKSRKGVSMEILDVPCQERFSNMIASYWKGADVILLMYESHYMHHLELLREWIEDVREENPDVIFALVGTRSDRVNPQVKTTTNYEKIEDLKKEFGITIHYDTSAKMNINVENVFEDVAETFAWRFLNKNPW